MPLLTEEEENRDSYLSWLTAIEWMREQHERGLPMGKLWCDAIMAQRKEEPNE